MPEANSAHPRQTEESAGVSLSSTQDLLEVICRSSSSRLPPTVSDVSSPTPSGSQSLSPPESNLRKKRLLSMQSDVSTAAPPETSLWKRQKRDSSERSPEAEIPQPNILAQTSRDEEPEILLDLLRDPRIPWQEDLEDPWGPLPETQDAPGRSRENLQFESEVGGSKQSESIEPSCSKPPLAPKHIGRNAQDSPVERKETLAIARRLAYVDPGTAMIQSTSQIWHWDNASDDMRPGFVFRRKPTLDDIDLNSVFPL